MPASMEEILKNRLIARHQRLIQATKSARIVVQQCCQGGVSEEELVLYRMKLKQTIEEFSKELFLILEKIQEVTFINDMTADQLIAEEVLVELEAVSHVNKSSTTVSAKLPKLNLPKFDGEKLKWHEFWDRFKSNIHDQSAIADADKMSYLFSSLEGRALEAISGLPTTNANYKIAIQTLENRFGSKDALIDAHYTALNNIPKAENTSISCRSTLDLIERHLRILEQLGEPVNGNNLRATILMKFPDKVVHEYHLLGDVNHTMESIRKNLLRIVMAMEKSSSLLTQEESYISLPPAAVVSTPSGATTEALHFKSFAVKKRRHEMPLSEVPRSNKKQKTQNFTTSRKPCMFCQLRNHTSADCRKFNTIEARKDKLRGRCLHCLRRNHKTEACKRTISCFRCKGDHLMILCPKPRTGEEVCSETVIEKTQCNMSHGYTFLQTAVVETQNPTSNNKTKPCRLVLDNGSQRSYITEKIAKALKLPTVKEDLLLIYTFGASSPHETVSPSTEIIVSTKRGVTRKLQVNIVPHITDRIPFIKFSHDTIDIRADDDTMGESIDILIGNDFYCSFMREKKIEVAENLYLVDSDFGWLVSGNLATENDRDILSVTTYCQCHTPNCTYFTEPDLPLRSIDIKFLWSLESIGITDSPKATRQEETVRHFNNTVKFSNGRYEVKWPWIDYPPNLPTNYGLAFGRLKGLLKRTDKETLCEYETILKKQIELGIIEPVDLHSDGEVDHPVHYLPHHIVKQKGKQGRIVYDASAKTTGSKSLNECLYSGPSLLEDLTALLLKFRTHKIGIVADVEKAFLQVGLQEQDRDVTRFLWLKNVEKEVTEGNLLCLRFCRVPFGVISSPFLLTATIRHHMSQSNQDLLKTIADKCYVDNLVTGAPSTQEAVQIYKQTRETFEELGMNIRDWISNDKEFMEFIPQIYKEQQVDKTKVLGLMWQVHEDTLRLKVTDDHFTTPVHTKRGVLRSLARVYDPCGFVSPLVLPMKLLFQETCKRKLKWDSQLPEDMTQSLKTTLENLSAVTKVELPRFIGIEPSTDDTTTYQLHCFSDASKHAYAAVIYLKAEAQHNNNVAFVMAKSRVSQQSQAQDQKELKIPKLELLGFLIGSRLLKYVKNALELNIKKEYMWTDSLVVLGWMSSNKLLPPFVANRVNEIKKNNPQAEMCYIHTKSNPADVATRPELWEEKQRLWHNGPDFLKADKTDWPVSHSYDLHWRTLFSVGEALEGGPGELDSIQEEDNDEVNLPELPMQRDEANDRMHDITVDMATADIKKVQKAHFPDELSGKKTHLSRNLDLFLDVDGVLRCRGRMANTTWNYDKKYPILLPKDSEFTIHIINETHQNNYHVGASHTLTIIREKYWIPQGKAQVQKIIRKCQQCVKHGGGPYKLPETPALPAERVNYSEPFTFTGLDYFGPLYVSTSTGKEKRWVALFTCLVIRAIHLEVVYNLTAEECLLAIRRFIAVRGVPKKIYSDNGTYFKLTAEVMEEPFCIDKKIHWKFIPQLAPWHGGFYERLIALVKHCLKRTLEKHLLNDSKLTTVMKEVEAVLNCRPLTKVGTEIEHVLRPSDFLSMGRILTVEPSSLEMPSIGTTSKVELIRSWRGGLKILEEFKRMFIGQYLTSLRERSQHGPKQPRIKSNRSPQVGDVVQIKSEHKNRDNWKVGKIVELISGVDGEYRVANVKVNDSILTRSIGHLYPLEADSEEKENQISSDNANATTSADVPVFSSDLMDAPTYNVNQTQNEMQSHESETPITEQTPGILLENDPEEDIDTSLPYETEPAPGASALNVETKSKRDAAVRAREKILEWTRLLLTLLK